MKKPNSIFRYGIGMFGTSLAINMFRGRASAFYVGEMGLTTDHLALIVLIYTFLDVIDNPIYGILSDNTRSRFGRRKPWLILGTPLFAISFILFYAPPETLGYSALFAWALFFYFLTGTLDSLINANYGALFPELFPDDKVRAKANAIRQASQIIAMVIGIGATPMVADAIGYVWTAVIYGVVSAVVIIYMALGMKEPPPQSLEKANFFKAVLSIIQSKNFWMVGFANAFYSAAMGLVMSSIFFYAKYALNVGSMEETIMLATVMVIAFAGVLVWSNFVRKKGAVKMWRIALISLAIAFVPLYFADTLIFAIVSAGLVGIGFSGVISTMDLLGAKVLDEDYAKHGIKREGIFSSTMGFMNRMSGLFISLGLFLASRIYGFKSGDEPGTRPDDAARFMLALFPLALTLIGVLFTFFVKFDDAKIRRRIDGYTQQDTRPTDDLLLWGEDEPQIY
ncbi:MAG: MFS transporter [Clostridia bacterium]